MMYSLEKLEGLDQVKLQDMVIQLLDQQKDLLWACKCALKRLKLSNDSESDRMVIYLVDSAIKKIKKGKGD